MSVTYVSYCCFMLFCMFNEPKFFIYIFFFFFFQAEDGIRDAQESRGLGDVYKRQVVSTQSTGTDGCRPMLVLLLLVATVHGSATPDMVSGPWRCEWEVGTCIVDPSCPAHSQCHKTGVTHTGSCMCDVGYCAVDGQCMPGPGMPPVPIQPALGHLDWFLNTTEIVAASGGQPRIGLQEWSSGNEVTAFAEGVDLWAEIYSETAQLGPGGRFWDTSWLIGPVYELVPALDANRSANTSIGAVLAAAGMRGAQVLALSWRNIASTARFDEVNAFVDLMQATATAVGKAGGKNRIEAYSDGRINPTGSLHQKTVVVTVGATNRSVAYLGGVDFCESRWDVFGSNSSYPKATSPEGIAWQAKMWNLRHQDGGSSPLGQKVGPGWHDTEFRLDGPAAFDVALNFAQRWNEQHCYLTDGVPVIQPPLVPIPEPVLEEFGNSSSGSHYVQVVRTFGCKYAKSSGCYSSFAPAGEQTVHAAVVKAVQTARHFLYIEDQYFFFQQELYDALREALSTRIRYLILVIQYPQEAPGMTTLLWRFWMPLFQEFPDRVHAFYRKGGIYIHSKTKLFDDVWAMVGSPNINYRSHTFDAEIAATVVDQQTLTSADGFTVAKFAHEWRLRLWEDATGVPASVWGRTRIEDAIGMWRAEAARPGGKLGAFSWDWEDQDHSIPEYEEWADNPVYRENVDPDGRCDGSESASDDGRVNPCPEGSQECMQPVSYTHLTLPTKRIV
eukprot:TRINITY_DN1765_c0_g1_i23.p1 TRINITY_DN1765_c0_g1~~TRINITY_DN1765_c0_g1_i23.p1  ORF type:complete len:726 (-),score=121.96 TRINITY_DN1765_c0_g1_i23:137-2314(-)